MNEAVAKPLVVTTRPMGAQLFAAESFSEEVRREIIQIYGEDRLLKGGLSVRTTLDPKLQVYARQALARGLIQFDRKRGYRGPIKQISVSDDWGQELGKLTRALRHRPVALGGGAGNNRDGSRGGVAAENGGGHRNA